MRPSEKTALLEALCQAIDAAGGTTQVAGVLNRDPSAFAQQLLAQEDDPQLGLFDTIAILDRSRFPLPFLYALAERYGFLLIPPELPEPGSVPLPHPNAILSTEEFRRAADFVKYLGACPSEELVVEMEAEVQRVAKAVETLRHTLQQMRALRTERALRDTLRLV